MNLHPSVPLFAATLLPRGYVVDDAWSEGRRHFIRASSANPDATGLRSYMVSNAGLCVSTAHMHYGQMTAETFPSSTNVMKIHVRLSGASRVGHEKGAYRSVREMSCSALIHPGGEEKLECFDGAIEERSVTVACSAEFLSQEFGVEGQSLPEKIVQFLEGDTGPMFGIDVPLALEARRSAEIIFGEFSEGGASALMIESRALELLARFFDQARSVENDTQPRVLGRDRRIAESARVLLEQEFALPPGLKALAREVGTHPAKLMRLFKAVHGTTISEYLEAFRMERARQLLEHGDQPVSQIAYEVGYEHPSNFATAFKRRFGASPSAVRAGAQPATT